MESIIASDIKSFLFFNGLISDHQFGFRPGHSTLDMLLLLSQQWMEVLNARHETRAISLDISCAFDMSGTLSCSPNSLPVVSKDISTHGSQTSSPVAAKVWPLIEFSHPLFLSRSMSIFSEVSRGVLLGIKANLVKNRHFQI